MKKEIINFENLGIYIVQIEKIFKDNEVNPVEQDLILTQVLNRCRTKDKNQQVQDMIGNVPLGGLLKRIMKSREKTEEEEKWKNTNLSYQKVR